MSDGSNQPGSSPSTSSAGASPPRLPQSVHSIPGSPRPGGMLASRYLPPPPGLGESYYALQPAQAPGSPEQIADMVRFAMPGGRGVFAWTGTIAPPAEDSIERLRSPAIFPAPSPSPLGLGTIRRNTIHHHRPPLQITRTRTSYGREPWSTRSSPRPRSQDCLPPASPTVSPSGSGSMQDQRWGQHTSPFQLPRGLSGPRATSSTGSGAEGSEQAETGSSCSAGEAGPSRPSVLRTRSSVKSTQVGMACTFCRRRKVRCDGETPCSKCARQNRECVYAAISVEESMAEKRRRLRKRESKEHEDMAAALLALRAGEATDAGGVEEKWR